jgi:pimeloyl-ACP methyl ester carboxylesterase
MLELDGRALGPDDLGGRKPKQVLEILLVHSGPDNGRYLAAHIPGATFVSLPGADHWPWFGDAESVLQPVESFLDQVAGRSEGFSRVRAQDSGA